MSTGDGRDGTIRSRMARGRLGGKLAGLTLPQQIMTIALWPFLEQVLSFIASSTALYLSSHMDNPPEVKQQIVAGMGAIGHVLFLGFVMQGAVGMGATAIVSRMTGARQFSEANYSACQAGVLGLMAGICSFLVMFCSTDFLVTSVFTMSPEAQGFAKRFMYIASFSAIFSGIVFAVNAALRGAGDTRFPFIMMLIADGLNIVISLILVNIFHLSIEGLAIGTISGFAISAVALCWILHRRHIRLKSSMNGLTLNEYADSQPNSYVPPLYLDRRSLKPDWGMIRRIIAIGMPQAIEVFGIWLIHLYCLSVISGLGDAVLAAHTIAVRIESMSFLPGFAIGMAASALVGQYLGAGSPKMAMITIRKCTKYSMIFMGTMGAIMCMFPQFFVGMFAKDLPNIIAEGTPVVRTFLILEPFFAAAIVMKMSLRGAGDTRRVMYVSYGVMGFFRIVILFLWHHYLPGTLNLTYIWLLSTVDQIVQAIIFKKFVDDRRWTKLRI